MGNRVKLGKSKQERKRVFWQQWERKFIIGNEISVYMYCSSRIYIRHTLAMVTIFFHR